MSLFADDIILYIKKHNQKLLELINKFSPVLGYKINIKKINTLPIINNESAEKEIRKNIPLIVAKKIIIKYLGMNLAKEVKQFYNESYRIFKKRKLEDARRWKDLPCS